MIVIEYSSDIKAPAQVCFDLARDVDDHVESMRSTGEKVIAGKMTGLLDLGDSMTLEAKQFGMRFRMTAKIIEFESPNSFVDEMVSGPFKKLWHVHEFKFSDGVTRMYDRMEVTAPLGLFGWIAERLLIKNQLLTVLKKRHAHIKKKAENSS